MFHPIVLAHELMGCLHDHYPKEFRGRLLGEGGEISLQQYWAGSMVGEDPRLVSHPLLQNPRFRECCIPCAVHADAVPFKKSQPGASLSVTAWSSLLGQGESTWDVVFLWDAVPSKMECTRGKHGVDTDELRFQVMRWDWEHALRGVYPHTDPWGNPWAAGSLRHERAGRPIASGFCMGLLQLRADMLHQVTEWQLKHYQAKDTLSCMS